uniref:Uncharacterized protein n=1 Tax=Cyprinus carpio TaxID=7962 RepID=A0A8C1VCR1_CYPCA
MSGELVKCPGELLSFSNAATSTGASLRAAVEKNQRFLYIYRVSVAVFGRCLCGRCCPMETVLESLCCREVSAFWSLVEELTPRPDVTCLTQHPGFEACCLNPFVLKIYVNFLGRHIRKPLPSCLVSAVRQQFHSGDETFHGFQWPRLDENE